MKEQLNFKKTDCPVQFVCRRTTGLPDELAFLKDEMRVAFKRKSRSYISEVNQTSDIYLEIDDECILNDDIDFNNLYS